MVIPPLGVSSCLLISLKFCLKPVYKQGEQSFRCVSESASSAFFGQLPGINLSQLAV